MKNIKKLFALILVAAMILTFAACGETGKDNDKLVVGINQYGEHASLDNCREGFIAGLKEAGFVEGENLQIDYQNAGSDNTIATQIAQSFSANDVDLMCAIATPSATACFAAAEDKNIPVIYTAITDPVEAKLVEGNITGSSDKLPVEAQLELIRKAQPDAKKIGIVYTLSEANSVSAIRDYIANAEKYGFEIATVGVNAQEEVTQAVDTLIREGVDCFSNLTDNNVVGVLSSILEKTNEAGIPVYGSEIEQVKLGCVASAGIDYYKLGSETGKMAAKILSGEATAEELDYITVTDYEVYKNSKALAEMNIELPAEVLENAVEAE